MESKIELVLVFARFILSLWVVLCENTSSYWESVMKNWSNMFIWWFSENRWW